MGGAQQAQQLAPDLLPRVLTQLCLARTRAMPYTVENELKKPARTIAGTSSEPASSGPGTRTLTTSSRKRERNVLPLHQAVWDRFRISTILLPPAS